MQKSFVGHLLLSIFLNLLVKPLAIFGIDAQVQNQVGTTEYGQYFALLNFTYLFNILLDVGITNFNTKYIAQYPHLAKNYIGKIISIRLLLFLVYAIFTISLGFVFSYSQKQFELLYWLIGTQFLISALQYFRSYFAGLFLFKIDILFSVMDKLLLILLAGYFIYFSSEPISVKLFVNLQFTSVFIAVLLAAAVLFVKVGLPKFSLKRNFSVLLLKKSLPYALLIVLMTLYSRLDSVMIERFSQNGTYQSGLYAQAYRLIDALFMFASLFTTFLFPMFSRILKNKESVVPLLSTAANLLLPAVLFYVFCAFFYSEDLLSLIYENATKESSPTFALLSIGFFFNCVILLFGTYLTASGNLRFLNSISFLGIIVCICLNFFLVPKYGAYGAAITNLSVQGILGLTQVGFVIVRLKLKAKIKTIVIYAGLVLLLSACSFLHFTTSPWLNMLVTGLCFGFYWVLTGMLNLKQLLSLVSQKS